MMINRAVSPRPFLPHPAPPHIIPPQLHAAFFFDAKPYEHTTDPLPRSAPRERASARAPHSWPRNIIGKISPELGS